MFSLKTDRQTGIQTDGKRLMGRQTDRQTVRQTDRWKNRIRKEKDDFENTMKLSLRAQSLPSPF